MNKFNEIAEFGKDLTRLKGIENSLDVIATKAKELVSADRCSVFIVDEEDNMLWSKHSDGIGRIVITADSGIVGDTYAKKESQIVNNPYDDSLFLPSIDKKSGYETKNILTVPIFNSKRDVLGVVQLFNKEAGEFNAEDLETITFFANYVSGNLELALMMDE